MLVKEIYLNVSIVEHGLDFGILIQLKFSRYQEMICL